jgi:uncharacterized protein (DUF1778 family)
MWAYTRKGAKVRLRLTRDAKRKLQAACMAVHCPLSEFVLESALARADEILTSRQIFILTAARWKVFIAALDTPSRPLPRLARLLKDRGFFDGSRSF